MFEREGFEHGRPCWNIPVIFIKSIILAFIMTAFCIQRSLMSFQARHNFGIVEIDGMLYILGGEDGEKELISMECYDIYSKTWTKQPDLTMVRKVRTISCVYKLDFIVDVFLFPT